ncbi:unnamed protein product [Gongylonema pulchrum]|uniref:Secreted protein n=1 Tax=Gongylonema pulchrum TaxID=637853 RepID=A0A183EGX1_9BILA|nr:unnamed protein product [Gongylonema pulchrum]
MSDAQNLLLALFIIAECRTLMSGTDEEVRCYLLWLAPEDAAQMYRGEIKDPEARTSRKEKEITRSEEKRERKRELPLPVSTRGKAVVEELPKTRERPWKRPIESSDGDETVKISRNDLNSSEKSTDSKGKHYVLFHLPSVSFFNCQNCYYFT